MKIVFYSVSVSQYGAPTSMLNLIEGLSRFPEHELVVVVPRHGPLTESLKGLNVRILRIPHYKWIYKDRYFQKLRQQSGVLAWIWFYKNAFQKFFFNLIFLPLHLLHVKKVLPDLIYVNASMGPMGIFVARILNIRAVWHHREPVNDPDTDFYIEWNARLWGRVINWPSVRIYNSRFLKGMYEHLPTRPFRGKSYIVYNGVPASTAVAPREDERVVFGMVGKVEQGLRKGQDEVLKLFSELDRRDVVLKIYGSGEPTYVNHLKDKYPQREIYFCGFKRPAQAYPEVDFLIMNSRNESFGRVVAEAYAYGVPVLALRSGALPEIVDEGRTGYLYENLGQLKQLILNMVDVRATQHYQELSDACKEKYRDNFTIERYTQNIIDVLSLKE
ncbi:MAG TPA: glycosyltransferase family 4 protein [Chryseolinea sp.]|nr:glycosyltransferase family 4 protein [Chryseolinea sp.]